MSQPVDPAILKRDRQVFIQELLKPANALLAVSALVLGCLMAFVGWWWAAAILAACCCGVVASAFRASIKHRFRNERFRLLWENSQDRLTRLKDALDSLRKAQIADLRDLPANVARVADQLYLALRRADMALNEITRSEGFLLGKSLPSTPQAANDAQAARLWEETHKTSLEYRRLLAGILGSVERTEAQAALYVATLDTLRVKMLGYRLVGRAIDSPSLELLQALAEARMQLDSIDKALDELEMSPFPTSIEDAPDLGALRETLQELDSAEQNPSRDQAGQQDKEDRLEN